MNEAKSLNDFKSTVNTEIMGVIYRNRQFLMKRHISKYFSVEMEKIPGVVVVHKKWASNCQKAPYKS